MHVSVRRSRWWWFWEPTGSLNAKLNTHTHTVVAAVFPFCFLLFFSFLMVISFFLSALLCSAVYCYFCHDFVQLLFFSDVAVCCFCCLGLSPSSPCPCLHCLFTPPTTTCPLLVRVTLFGTNKPQIMQWEVNITLLRFRAKHIKVHQL